MINNLHLDIQTGFLTWLSGSRKGKRAGSLDRYGYRQMGLNGKVVRAHRVVWFIFHGGWPEGSIDHINGDRDDNRPSNLRLSNPTGQMQNRAMPSSNTSGVHGVTWHKSCGKWQASISVNNKYIHLGLFSCIDQARSARVSAEKKYGFHDNHGRTSP